jgi:hypothetical protein
MTGDLSEIKGLVAVMSSIVDPDGGPFIDQDIRRGLHALAIQIEQLLEAENESRK